MENAANLITTAFAGATTPAGLVRIWTFGNLCNEVLARGTQCGEALLCVEHARALLGCRLEVKVKIGGKEGGSIPAARPRR